MTAIALATSQPLGPAQDRWQQLMEQLLSLLQTRGVHPARAVVLLPYAQLMQQAKAAWALAAGTTHFVPRFETTMNWASSLGAVEPNGNDIRLDAAHDVLTAAALLKAAGLASQADTLAARLVEAAWSLTRLAAAVPPDRRTAWGEELGEQLKAEMDAPVLQLEAALGQIALAWVASSSYPTDVLFAAQPDLLVLLEGFQAEPLSQALQTHWGERAISMSLDGPGQVSLPALHAARDAEDEAQRAAACVLTHLAQGRSPVALIAQDRQMTRRIRAMLDQRGVAIRDETGWKLSTTRAAASLMGMLRAMAWNASTDVVLDWLKNAPTFDSGAVAGAEKVLRRAGVRQWHAASPLLKDHAAFTAELQNVREPMQRPRPLSLWLRDLRAALQAGGQWEGLALDVAGQSVLEVLRLQEGAEVEFSGVAGVMGLSAFSSWVSQALEAGNFSPAHPPEEQVLILPLSQLLGRNPAAVVFPGCGESGLPVSPEPPGMWTPAQRLVLGLPARTALAAAQRAAWNYALRFPRLDLLWRESESGERVMASGFVQELQLQQSPELAPDPRQRRPLPLQPTERPMPLGDALPVIRLSASAYEDLRRCPYRFFALRQLRLQESDELDSELDKRDFGNWLHTLLKTFHDGLKAEPVTDVAVRRQRLDQAAAQAALSLALSDSEFLPFSASWPRVRESYLNWLTNHESEGAVFDAAEVSAQSPLGALTLIGKIDRIDRLPDGSTLVIDYKTEPRATTAERLKQPQEDTQLAFYAALLSDDTLGAAYVNIAEKEATRTYAQADIVELRDALLDSIQNDMGRIAAGAPLPALGEGTACDYCAARGLCRKDFWE
jgi:ATP-dependent helicase/nuclease subunit B